MNDPNDFANASDPFRLRMIGAIRRMTIKLATKALWQLVGFSMDGADEVVNSEVFAGIGFYARPKQGNKLEAIVLMVGADASTPVIVATRDEATRAAVEQAIGGFAPDTSALYNTKSIVMAKPDGTIEARTVGGTAKALPTLLSVQQIGDALAGAITTLTASGTPAALVAIVPLQAFADALHDATQGGDPLWPSSTTILKGE